MRSLFTAILITLTAVMFSACSYESVPQGAKGKVLDRGGFHPEVYPPSRVDVGTYGKLILVDTTTHTVNETVTVRMNDNMNLVPQVRFQLRMGSKTKSLDAVFNDIKPKNGKLITLQQVYDTYGKMIVNKVTREVLSPYAIGDVNKNFNRISAAIYKKVKEDFKPTPLAISDVALGKLTYPKIIDDAIQAAAKRELEIKTAEADVQVKMTELTGREKLAAGKYRIAMQLAKRDRDANKMIAAGITPALLKLRELENQALLIEAIKGNQNVIYLPSDMMGNMQYMKSLK